MKFITLTTQSEGTIKINATMIVALEQQTGHNTRIYTITGGSWTILESIEEIENKIKESERVTLKTWETGPR